MTMLTLKYKGAYIHIKTEGDKETATVQIFNDTNFFTKECKSFRAAQIFITKYFKNDKYTELNKKDVVRVISGQCEGKTGVVNRTDGDSINVFLKGVSIGIWFQRDELKKIGRVK